MRPDGSGAGKARSLPATYDGEEQTYVSLAYDGEAFYAGEESQDAVHRSAGRRGRETLANDLYLNHLLWSGGRLWWAGSEGVGRIDPAGVTVETLSDRPRVRAVFVTTEPASWER